MKVEFRFNGKHELHLTPESDEESFMLNMISSRAKNKAGVASVSGIDHGDRTIGMVISVEK